ncbi:MAG: GNAT family N-acetyltransferase [Propionibacteriales bacterium]|nr:GNAT family N-acetyltransferase [Propionibacteriales bacterium]
MTEVAFTQASVESGDGARLLDDYAAEIAALYDGADLAAPGMPSAGPAELAPPHGAFLVGYQDGNAVCCGALKRLDDGVAEIKRMYVVPTARRQGVARLLLHALEDVAAARGYRTLRMDTGPKHQHAIAFYEAEGYRPVPDYNGNPLATWFGQKTF